TPGRMWPGCGGSNIVEDDLYCQPQRVCVDCGSVVSEGVLASEPVVGPVVTYSRTTAVAKKPCLQRVKAMCRILMVHREIEQLSQTYYNKAYQHESFLKVSLQKKEVLAGCCVLVSCRLLNWPITMATILCLINADPTLVGEVYQEMIKVLWWSPYLILFLFFSGRYKISSLHLPEEFAENSKDLTRCAVALVELAADSWIVTGRKPVPIIMAAVYLAWQSLRPTKQRLKTSLEKFCQIAKVNKYRPAVKRIAEIKEALCKLGKEIPWVREAVTPDNVVQHVEDILQHRYALLRRAMRTHQDALQEGRKAEQTPNSSSVKQCEPNEEGRNDVELNWGKRVLFAPPCVIRAKRRRVEQPELQDVTGDEEISDSEIDSYIRTPQEARDFALTQKISVPNNFLKHFLETTM
uniref:BRF2-like C-terminal domain-containing protein n=1 Tax=Monopterus albus TaxID=43700 RepID=A0A3Q3K2D8_MONAL